MVPAPPPAAVRAPLGAAAVLLLALLALAGLEGAVRRGYRAPGTLLPRVEAARGSIDEASTDLLLFGTCLGEQTLDHATLARALGPYGRVHSLAAAGAVPMDWYLALRALLSRPGADAVAIAYAPGDLLLPGLGWQVQTLDLVDWAALHEVAWWTCSGSSGVDAECAVEVYLRKASHLYRDRPYLANRVWSRLGLRWADPRGPSPGARAGATPLGSTPWRQPASPFYWVRRFVAVARAAGIEPLFLELPRNPDAGAETERTAWRALRAELGAELTRMGVEVHAPSPPPHGFEDDVHLSGAGRAALTAEVARWLRERVASSSAPADAGMGN